MPRDNVDDVQERLAFRYGLSRQGAMMLALLVCLPQVNQTTVAARMGRVDVKVVVSKLRSRMRAADYAVIIHNARSFGYYIDNAAKEHLNARDAQDLLAEGANYPIRGVGPNGGCRSAA